MRAIITPSDIEFSVSQLDLGYCTTVESVRQTITITNKSILAQMYGFCGVPEVCLTPFVVLEQTKWRLLYSSTHGYDLLLHCICLVF